MYQCEKCKQTVPPGTKANRVVVKTRRMTYPGNWVTRKIDGKPKRVQLPDYIGYEPSRELTVCEDCHAKLLEGS